MNFILRMARREIRSSWRRLIFFFVCIGVGVGSIVAVRSTLQNATSAMVSQARLLLGADVQVDSTRALDAETKAVLDRIAQTSLVTGRTETVELSTMARPNDKSKESTVLVELKAVSPGFPLYGNFNLTDGQSFSYRLLENQGTIVAQGLLDRLDLKIGDKIRIGNLVFEIRGVMSTDPGGSTGFRMGPRVFIARSVIEETGLVGLGSRARYRTLLSTGEGTLDALVGELRSSLNNLIRVRTYKESEENLNEQYTRSENYLSLVGLVILVLGGIGVANVTRVFIEQKKKAIAVLKCVGATSSRIATVYVAQVIALGLAGSLFGIGLARLALVGVERYLAANLPPNMSHDLRPGTVIQGLLLGLLVSLLFSALPLLRVRHIRPNMLLRDEDTPSARRLDLLMWTTGLVVIAGLVALFSWQAGSLRIGAFFLAGVAVTAAVLQLASMGLVWAVKHTRQKQSFAVRHAINSLHRPGNQTRVILMAVGLGAFLVIAVQSLQRNLLLEIDPANRGHLPNMYVLDVQKDQKEGVEGIIKESTGERTALIPTVRARIAAINGKEIDLGPGEMRRDRGRLGREYVLTYRSHLEENETIVAGNFWDATPSVEPEVSIAEEMQGLQGLDIGGNITLDIVGRKLTARVTSVRQIDWRRSRTGFLILFRPNVLDNAPTMYVGGLDAPGDDRSRSRLQRRIVESYPNVSIIDVGEVLQIVTRLLANVSLAVTFVGAFVFLSGTLILIGSIAMTKYQRTYEAALLKTLGATRKTVLTTVVAEYGILGLIAGIIGSATALVVSYAMARYLFEIPWVFIPSVSVAGVVGTMALVVLVGVIASIPVLSRKPLGVLRSP